jgi:hypothetical protein
MVAASKSRRLQDVLLSKSNFSKALLQFLPAYFRVSKKLDRVYKNHAFVFKNLFISGW